MTMDTHPPAGHTSRSCKDMHYSEGANSYLNSVYCGDYLISDFIEKIQNSKYAKNTLIVLTSDHLTMESPITNLLEKGKRRDLFLIFDPLSKKYISIDKPGSMFDVAPTVLYKLGIDTELGLGRNLFVGDSLISLFKNFDQKLMSWRDKIMGRISLSSILSQLFSRKR